MINTKRLKACVSGIIIALIAAALLVPTFGTGIPAHAAEGYSLATVYVPDTKLVDPPAILRRVNAWSTVTAYAKAEERPTMLWFRMGSGLNVVSEDGSVLGTVAEALAAVNGRIVPVFQVSDNTQANALMAALASHPDAIVASEDKTVLLGVRDKKTLVRTAWIVTDPADLKEVAFDANINKTKTVVIDTEKIDKAGIAYLRARWISVWLSGETSADKRDTVLLGANGILTDEVTEYYGILSEFRSMRASEVTFVAHRGTSSMAPENTLEALIAAANCGAGGMEYDLRASFDGELVIMHDPDIDRMTTGTGLVRNLTLAQLKEVNVRFDDTDYRIPTLREIFTYFQDKPNIHVVELKPSGEFSASLTAFIRSFCDMVREFDMADRVIVISFDPAQLMRCYDEMPQLPTSLLKTQMIPTLDGILKTTSDYDCSYSPDIDYISGESDLLAQTSLRGLLFNSFTSNGEMRLRRAMRLGVSHITTDDIHLAQTYVTGIEADPAQTAAVGDTLSLEVQLLTKSGKPAVQEITSFEIVSGGEHLSGADGVYTATSEGTVVVRPYYVSAQWQNVVYANHTVTVTVGAKGAKKGCGKTASAVPPGAGALLLLLIFLKKRNTI